MTRNNRFRFTATLVAAALFTLTSLVAHSRLRLELMGESSPEDAEEFTEAYENCTSDLLSAELIDGPRATSRLALRYRPAPLYANVDNMGLRAYFTSPSYMVRDNTVYRLVSLEFHVPGDGIAQQGEYPLMAHFVHYGQDGSLGVLGVRFVEGEPNAELDKLLAAASGDAPNSGLNPKGILPSRLNTPYSKGPADISGCDYQMYWYFTDQPVQASAEQIARARAFLAGSDA